MGRNNARARGSRQRSDREKLELFLKLATALGTTDLAKKGFSYRHSIKWNKAEGYSQNLEQPSENDLRSFLITFRKFVSEDSDAYLQAIHRIVYRRLTREEYREDLGKMNEKWRKLFTKGWMRLNINGRELPPEYALKMYINGKYFHDDPDYADEIAQLEQTDEVGSLFQRAQFLDAVVSTSKYVGWLAHNIDYLLEQGLLDFEDKVP